MKEVSIIGAGTMGNGIAHAFAQAGFKVNLADLNGDALSNAVKTITSNLDRQVKKELITETEKSTILKNISTNSNIQEAVKNSDLVIEAIIENEEAKKQLFGMLDSNTKPETILASNTSSISITRIGSATKRPDKVIGMHFMNPVPVMKLVEIINGYSTSAKTSEKIKALTVQIGKVPVLVEDYPGFVANRILMPMINESIYTLFEGVAGVEEIDTVMKLGMAHPMGPLQLADFIGLDVCLFILQVLHKDLGNPKYFPCPLLANMVAAGNKGVKSGAGFYKYTAGSKELVVADRFRKS